MSFASQREKAILVGVVHQGRHEVANVIHGVIVLLHGKVLAEGILPAVERKLTHGGGASVANPQRIVLKGRRRLADAVEHIILSWNDLIFSAPTNQSNEACRGGVDGNGRDVEVADQLAKCRVMFLVGARVAFFSRVEVIFPDAIPNAVVLGPKAHRGWIHGAVVAGDEILIEAATWKWHEGLWFSHFRIDNALRGDPLALDEALVEGSAVQVLVALLYLVREGGVVVEGEVQVEGALLGGLLNPLLIEPMLREFGVAVEPKLRATHRASRQSLLHKRLWHQGDLIEEDAREGNALNERRAGLVLAGEQVKFILDAPKANGEQVLGNLEVTFKAELNEGWQNRIDEISLNGAESFPANREG